LKIKDVVSGFFTGCKNVRMSEIDGNFSRIRGLEIAGLIQKSDPRKNL
jgi:hypothetical protein